MKGLGRFLIKRMKRSGKYQETWGKTRTSWLNKGWLLGFWFEWEVNGNITKWGMKYQGKWSWSVN